jgi:hypothetical protein
MYADRHLRDKQILAWLLLRRTKKYEHDGRLNLNFTFCFMDRTQETLHVDKRSLAIWNTMDIPASLIWISICFEEAFEDGKDAKWWGYVVTNAEPLCVEFCNFVQYQTFVNYLTCY